MYTITASEQTKFLTADFMPVSTDSTVSQLRTDGEIESLQITAGSGYTDGTYYAAVYGDGTSAGTSSGASCKYSSWSRWNNNFFWTNCWNRYICTCCWSCIHLRNCKSWF